MHSIDALSATPHRFLEAGFRAFRWREGQTLGDLLDDPPRGTAPSSVLPLGLDGHGAVLGRGGGVALHDLAGYAVLLAIFLSAVMVVVRGYYTEQRRECKA